MKIRIVTFALLSLVIATPSFAQTNEDAKAAFADMTRKCNAVMEPFDKLTPLISMNGGVTPAMLGNNNYATDSEAELLKRFLPAFQTCRSYLDGYIKTYFPWNTTVAIETSQQDVDVIDELMAKKITYAQANRKFIDINAEFNAESNANNQKESQARLAGGNLSAAQQAAVTEVKRICSDSLSLFSGGMLSGKVPLRPDEPTPAMMADETYPTQPETVALHNYIQAFAKCHAARREYYKSWETWQAALETYIVDSETPVLVSLAARQITYGMANRNFADINKRSLAKWQAAIQAEKERRAAQNGAPVPSESDVAGALGRSAN